MSEQPAESPGESIEERRSWFPLILALVFLVFSVGIAFVAFFVNRIGVPSQARTVDDVSQLVIEAIDRNDSTFYVEILCANIPSDPVLAVISTQESAVGSTTQVEGEATGTFALTILASEEPGAASTEYVATVAQDGERSCLSGVTAAE